MSNTRTVSVQTNLGRNADIVPVGENRLGSTSQIGESEGAIRQEARKHAAFWPFFPLTPPQVSLTVGSIVTRRVWKHLSSAAFQVVGTSQEKALQACTVGRLRP